MIPEAPRGQPARTSLGSAPNRVPPNTPFGPDSQPLGSVKGVARFPRGWGQQPRCRAAQNVVGNLQAGSVVRNSLIFRRHLKERAQGETLTRSVARTLKTAGAIDPDPDRDWTGWTWTATVTVTDEDDKVESRTRCCKSVPCGSTQTATPWNGSTPDV